MFKNISTEQKWEEEQEWQEEEEKEEGFVSAPLLTVPEAARYLGVGKKVIYQLIESDRVVAVKVKRAVMVERRTLDPFLDSGVLL